jgi:tripartite-type tricarboxylate transporter receptor subunit TctC
MIAARQSAHKTDDAGMMNAWSNAYGLALGAVLAASAGPSVAAPDEFYAGRTITVITSGGGAYEAYGRALSRHMPKYIPGHPTMIVQAMPGAGGARAASYLYKAAARDGTFLGGIHGAVLTAPFLNPGAADFDVTKFSWIGNVTRDKYVGYVWHTAPVQSLAEAKTKQLVVGGTSVGGLGIDGAIVLKDIFGYKLKIVSGYKTSNEVKIALERGEVEGTLGNALSSLNQTDWLAKKLVRIIVQHGSSKHRELADVPLLRDLARDDGERQMIDILNVRDEITRPYLAPPGIPPARLDILRRAFDAAVRDPAFLADVQRQRLEVEGPSTGEEIAAVAEKLARTSPAVVERLVALLGSYK